MSGKQGSFKKTLNDPLQFVKGVGPKRVMLLQKLQVESVADALYFLPFRYDDRSQVKKIAELVPDEMVSFTGKIIDAGTVRMGRYRKLFEAVVQDDSGFIRVKWFQFNESYMAERIKPGKELIFSGKPTQNKRGGGLEM
ncbi:MAG TPA: OB-fold nucleic acid binding domain-containing protein, partial [Nitrospinaceae bacterium]|nr:OB-fold nucleic acid binding domain-containing protein [Nitrospinaceae bacterium]